ncbi:MAG: ABC transporter permease subunit [Clostridiales Family XIII bacterium]|nr:ABC transporter permease subunit [Clostridiales Family XIII bacterium]
MKGRDHRLDSALGIAYSWISMLLMAAVCLFILVTVARYGAGKLSLEFLITEPGASAVDIEGGGILTPLIGTVLLTMLGMLAALPFSLATAVYICFYARPGALLTLVETAVDILAGVPTVVIALFSLSIFVLPQFGFLSAMIETDGDGGGMAYGRSFLVCAVTMAIMILPFVTKSIIESLRSVPGSYIDGAFALGAGKWRVVAQIALRCARPGIVTGTVLGMGRIVGDTAIVWFALGGTLRMTGVQPWYMPENWISTLRNTGSTLTTYIYYTSPAGEGNSFDTAFGASLVLIGMIILLNAAAALVGRAWGGGNGQDAG